MAAFLSSPVLLTSCCLYTQTALPSLLVFKHGDDFLLCWLTTSFLSRLIGKVQNTCRGNLFSFYNSTGALGGVREPSWHLCQPTEEQTSAGLRPELGKGERLWEAACSLRVSFQTHVRLEDEPVRSHLDV